MFCEIASHMMREASVEISPHTFCSSYILCRYLYVNISAKSICK